MKTSAIITCVVETHGRASLPLLITLFLHLLCSCSVKEQEQSLTVLSWNVWHAGTRDDEIRKILSVLQPMIAESDSIPLIMGGDFNSHSHLDWTEATRNLYNHGGAVVGWTVSKELENARFKDSFREINPDPVQHIGTTWLTDADSLETPNRQDRIDFIYYKGKNIQATASECYDQNLGETFSFKGEDFFYASDHGFVLTTFKIKR